MSDSDRAYDQSTWRVRGRGRGLLLRGATESGRGETSASGTREDVGVGDEGEVVEEGEEGVVCEGVLGLRWGYFSAKLGG